MRALLLPQAALPPLSSSLIDDISAPGNMWDVPEFKAWLGQTFGDPSLWETLIRPAMKHIVICTSKCAQV